MTVKPLMPNKVDQMIIGGQGALRGHMQAGAEKVILSALFKIKSKGLDMPCPHRCLQLFPI